MNKKKCYELLEINANSSQDEIKRAYKKLAIKYHPDKNKNSEKEEKIAEEKFKEISEAYQYLTNPDKNSSEINFEEFKDFIDANSLFNQLFGNNCNFSSFHEINPTSRINILRQPHRQPNHKYNINKGNSSGITEINLNDLINNSLNLNSININNNFTSFSTNNLGANSSRQVKIYYENGKKIEKIIEINNGKRIEKTIVTDIK